MLKHLFVSNFAIIDEVNVEFDKGLSIITGETGAGKSILLDALNLIIGQRADSSMIKDIAKKCIIEATFNISKYSLSAFFADNELDYSDDTIVRREISSQGKSRVFINDTPVSLNQLKDFSNTLIDIHSQHESLTLNEQKYQLGIIDAFANNIEIVDLFKKEFNFLNSLKHEQKKLIEKESKAIADLDYFKFMFNELAEAELIIGEKSELETSLKVLSNAELIKNQLLNINSIVSEGDFSVLNLLKNAKNAFSTVAELNPQLKELFERINSCSIELKDIAQEASNIEETVSLDNEKIGFINERLDKIYRLEKKHHVDNENDLIAIKNDFDDKINSIESLSNEILKIEKQIDEQLTKTRKIAEEISNKRKKAVVVFQKEIENTLSDLGMLEAKFIVSISDEENLNAYGSNIVDFLFSANKGIKPQAISKIASGGELSRLMLAVKNCISSKIQLPTIIFDEIDTGVSGAVAEKVAHLMKQLSAKMQVITITHLPQTASKGDNHYLVFKETTKDSTRSIVKKLSKEERHVEIAKMLSGNNVSEAAMRNAKELLS
ncbi:MAG: DNA repair protein RecN [Bacteroidota bacterium]